MSLNSLPPVSQQQIDLMNKAAQKQYGVTNDPIPEVEEQVLSNSLETEEAVATPMAAAESETPEETQEQPTPISSPPPPKPRAYSKEENMALLRERAKRAEAEREDLARQLQSYQQKLNQNPVQSSTTEPEDFSMAPDELAEGKHIAKLQKKIKSLEEQMHQGKQYSASAAAEARLRTTYPDFDKVVSQSNIAALSEMFPDVAKTIGDSQDLYSKAVTAYTVIKNLGIYQDDFAQEKKIAATNAVKPRPLTSISPQQGDTPLSRANAFANGLTDDLRKTLQKEMFEAMKNRY